MLPFTPTFAPYLDFGQSDQIQKIINTVSTNNDYGITAAFITAARSGKKCTASIAGKPLTANSEMLTQLKAFKGPLYISFGGATGEMLAQVCTQDELLTQYNNVYTLFKDMHNFKGFDFDIEGDYAPRDENVLNSLPVVLQNFAQLHPSVELWLTLPVAQEGFTDDIQTLILKFVNKKTGLSGVNIMAMDYGSPVTNMGQAAITAANKSLAYLKTYRYHDSPKTSTMLVITPMTGQNGVSGEIFNIDNANALVTEAQDKDYGGIRFWSLNRDLYPTAGSRPENQEGESTFDPGAFLWALGTILASPQDDAAD